MSDLKYSEDHEWIQVEGEIGTIGISNYAQEQLGDIVFVELPAIGTALVQGDKAATVESVKAASEVFCPVDCEVVEVNQALTTNPGQINSDPLGEGWFVKVKLIRPEQVDELMDEAAYLKFVSTLQ